VSVWCDKALAEVWWVPTAVILDSVTYSAGLNSFCNLRHVGWSRVLDPRQG
jgi:hypothetical protein